MSRDLEVGSGSYGRVNGGLIRWSAGVVSVAVLGAAGLFALGISRDVEKAGTKSADQGERLARLEAVLPVIDRRLERIETMLQGALSVGGGWIAPGHRGPAAAPLPAAPP